MPGVLRLPPPWPREARSRPCCSCWSLKSFTGYGRRMAGHGGRSGSATAASNPSTCRVVSCLDGGLPWCGAANPQGGRRAVVADEGWVSNRDAGQMVVPRRLPVMGASAAAGARGPDSTRTLAMPRRSAVTAPRLRWHCSGRGHGQTSGSALPALAALQAQFPPCVEQVAGAEPPDGRRWRARPADAPIAQGVDAAEQSRRVEGSVYLQLPGHRRQLAPTLIAGLRSRRGYAIRPGRPR